MRKKIAILCSALVFQMFSGENVYGMKHIDDSSSTMSRDVSSEISADGGGCFAVVPWQAPNTLGCFAVAPWQAPNTLGQSSQDMRPLVLVDFIASMIPSKRNQIGAVIISRDEHAETRRLEGSILKLRRKSIHASIDYFCYFVHCGRVGYDGSISNPWDVLTNIKDNISEMMLDLKNCWEFLPPAIRIKNWLDAELARH